MFHPLSATRNPLVLAAGVALLVGCGSNKYCLVDQPYQNAAAVPEIQATEGLQVPQSPSALRLPEAPENRVPFGIESADGDGQCLDQPPALKVRSKKKS